MVNLEYITADYSFENIEMGKDGYVIRLDYPHGTKYQMMKVRIKTTPFQRISDLVWKTIHVHA